MNRHRQDAMVDAFADVVTAIRDRVARHRNGMNARQVAALEAELTRAADLVRLFRGSQ